MKEVSEYWINNYNWKEREKYYNSFDQYITTIDELDIHFVHVKSEIENATPLIMSHGWPGSFHEILGIINSLAHPEKFGGNVSYDSFESLGSDFSQKKLHPADLKQAVGESLVKIVSPVRDKLDLSEEISDLIKNSY